MSTSRLKKIPSWARWTIAMVLLVIITVFALADGMNAQHAKDVRENQQMQKEFKATTAKDYPWIKLVDVSKVKRHYGSADVIVKIGEHCSYQMLAEESGPYDKPVWNLVPYTQESPEDLWSDLQLENGAPPYGDASCPDDPLKQPTSG